MDSEVSGSPSVLFDKLQLAIDTFRLDQEERTAKLRSEVEAMFMQHDQNFGIQRYESSRVSVFC